MRYLAPPPLAARGWITNNPPSVTARPRRRGRRAIDGDAYMVRRRRRGGKKKGKKRGAAKVQHVRVGVPPPSSSLSLSFLLRILVNFPRASLFPSPPSAPTLVPLPFLLSLSLCVSLPPSLRHPARPPTLHCFCCWNQSAFQLSFSRYTLVVLVTT